MRGSTEEVVETVIPARRMHCDNCARNIDRNLAKAKGVERVTADATRKEVLVAYRVSETNEEALRHELEEMGFR